MEWEEKKLVEIMEIQSGFAFKSEYFSEEGIKLVIPKNFTKYGYGNFNDNISKFSSENPSENYKCKEGDLLILLTDLTPSCGLLGKPLMIKNEDGEVWLNQRIVRLDVNKEVLKNWLLYFLQTEKYHKVIKETATGSTVRHSSNKIIQNIILQIPEINEQTKIASFLSILDSKIDCSIKIIEGLTILKKGMAKKIFSQEFRFKNDKGNDFPDWRKQKLKDIAFKKSSNISANVLDENQGEFKIYGAIGLLKMIDFYKEEEPYIAIVKDGAGVGRLLFCEGKSSVLGTLDVIKNNNKTDLRFLYYILNTIDFSKYTTGSTIPHIYFKDYSNEDIGFPSLPEQQKIANFFFFIDNKIEVETSVLQKLEEQKKYLLQNMFV